MSAKRQKYSWLCLQEKNPPPGNCTSLLSLEHSCAPSWFTCPCRALPCGQGFLGAVTDKSHNYLFLSCNVRRMLGFQQGNSSRGISRETLFSISVIPLHLLNTSDKSENHFTQAEWIWLVGSICRKSLGQGDPSIFPGRILRSHHIASARNTRLHFNKAMLWLLCPLYTLV